MLLNIIKKQDGIPFSDIPVNSFFVGATGEDRLFLKLSDYGVFDLVNGKAFQFSPSNSVKYLIVKLTDLTVEVVGN